MEADWSEAAKDLKGVVKFGAVNNIQNDMLSKKFKVSGVPAISYLGQTKDLKNKPSKYNGPRDKASLI